MKKCMVTLIALCLTTMAMAQGGVVSAPALEKLTTSALKLQAKFSATLALMEKKQEALNKALQSSTWLKNLKTARRILYMVETMVCNGKELDMAMSLYASLGKSDCFSDFEYEMVITKIQMSADYLEIIFALSRMAAGERMKTLNDVLSRFEEAQKDMDRLLKKWNGHRELKIMIDMLDKNPPSGVRFVKK